jgi:amino acid adenylation domain-containing protein/non-ribosomal peptide synthase protein (TIGR01720 family)
LDDFIEKEGTIVQKSLNLETGPLVKAAVFQTDQGSRILLCIHHLVVDGISWRVILEDLNEAYESAFKQTSLRLPSKTLSFKEWSEYIYEYRESDQLKSEINDWRFIQRLVQQSKFDLGLPDERVFTKPSKTVFIQTKLTSTFTSKLLFLANQAYHTEINDLFITSLFRAIHKLTGLTTVSVNMEGHGREAIHKPAAIDRTVGWFTTIYPTASENIGSSIEKDIITVKENLRRIPNKGMGFSVLSYIGERVFEAVSPQITFNYLGDFKKENEQNFIKVQSVEHGQEISPRNRFGTPIAIDCFIVDEELLIVTAYDNRKCNPFLINDLAQRFHKELEQVVSHCINIKEHVTTASDFGELAWTDDEFRYIREKTSALSWEMKRIYPLTMMQEGMLYHKTVNPKSKDYVVQTVFDIEHEIDIDRLKQSIALLFQKHDVLRTNIIYKKVSAPRQVVFSKDEYEIHFLDMSAQPDPEKAFVAAKERDRNRNFYFETDSLFRALIFKISESQFRLLLTFHHIIMDGWCVSFLLNDIERFYFELQEGRTVDITADYSFETYVRKINAAQTAEGFAYWEQLLGGFEGASVIPPEHKNVESTQESAILTDTLTEKEVAELSAAAVELGVSMNSFLEAAWGILLRNYNFADDAVFGKIVSGRNIDVHEIERLVGLCINTIPVRIAIEKDKTIKELLLFLKDQALDSSRYEFCSLAEIQNRVGGNLSVQSIIAFENYFIPEAAEERVLNLQFRSTVEQTNFPISVNVRNNKVFEIDLMYGTRIYEKQEAARILRRFKNVLLMIIRHTDKKISEIELSDAAEKNIVLNQFNQTDQLLDTSLTIKDIFEAVVAKDSDHVACIFGEKTVTYRVLNAQANYTASLLAAEHIGKNDVVAVLMERSIEVLTAIYGIIKSGAAYMPIDSSFPAERIRFILKDSGCRVVLFHSQTANIVEQLNIKKIDLSRCGQISDNPVTVAKADSPLYVIYTSGTTGTPKGVIINSINLQNMIRWLSSQYGIHENSIVLQRAAYIFDASVMELFAGGLNGATLVMASAEENKNIDQLCNLIYRSNVSFMVSSASLLRVMMQYLHENNLSHQLAGVKDIILGGEVFTEDLYRHYKDNIYPAAERLNNLYGPTECTVCVSHYNLKDHMDNEIIPIGKPIDNTEFYVIRDNKICGIGLPGELCVSGLNVSCGYLNNPALTESKFVKLNEIGEKIIYKTGDLARWDENGSIEYLGRIDTQVKVRGFRIELEEIEAIIRTQENIIDAVVLLKKETGDEYLCAYIVSEHFNEDKLRTGLGLVLPAYMMPSFFVPVDAIPTNKSNKVDKQKLLQLKLYKERKFVTPVRDDLDKTLVNIFSKIFDNREIYLEDNFFELGGHSLKATRLVTLIESTLGKNISIATVMRLKTVKAIADELRDNCDDLDFEMLVAEEENSEYILL